VKACWVPAATLAVAGETTILEELIVTTELALWLGSAMLVAIISTVIGVLILAGAA
jgi:hypothetical protein